MPKIKDDQSENVQDTQDKDNETEQFKDDQNQQIDFQSYIDKLNSVVDEKLNKVIGNWSNEVGEMRKTVEAVNEKFNSFEERFQRNDDDEVDLYDQKILSEFIAKQTKEAQKPIIDKLEKMSESFVTEDFLNNWLKLSQTVAMLQKDFKLTDKEIAELNAESQETGENIELLAFRKFGDRKFTNKKQLVDELKKNDSEPPIESGRDERFKKLKAIPDKFEDFHRMHKEKGSEEMRRLIKEATTKGE